MILERPAHVSSELQVQGQVTTCVDWHIPTDHDRGGEPDVVFMLVPALGVARNKYIKFGQSISSAGVVCAVIDLRGVGSSSVRAKRGVDWGYLDLIDGELRALWQAVDQRFPAARKIWLGHSLGGHLSLLHQARHVDQPVDQLALVASGSPWYRQYPGLRRWGVRAFGAFARASSRVLGVFRGDLLGFGGAQGQRLMREWGDFCTKGRLPALGETRWDPHQHLPNIVRRKFALAMHGDTYAPLATTEHLASLLPGELKLEQVESVNSNQPPGHFGWMRYPELIAQRLVAQLA